MAHAVIRGGTVTLREANAEIDELGHIARVWEFKAPHGPLGEDRFHLLLADGLAPPFPAGVFDTVVTPWFIDLVPPDLREFIGTVSRLLTSGCAAGPVTDLHIKSGVHGAMIVYSRTEQLRPAREIVVVEDAVYGTRDANGLIPGTDPAKTAKNDQLFSMFNGRLDNDPVRVNPGDLVRMYFVNVGRWVSAAMSSARSSIASLRARRGSRRCRHSPFRQDRGRSLSSIIPEAGVFPFVDHDKLAFLPSGLAFASEGVPGAAH